jgi:O-Antigen ligase
LSSLSPVLRPADPDKIRSFTDGLVTALLSGATQPLRHAFLKLSLVFIGSLAVFLFRPPDLELHHADRIVFGILGFVVLLRTFLVRQRLPWIHSISWPMAGLLLLALYAPMTQPFNVQTWSLFAAKFLVPFTLFHLACLVFGDDRAVRHFETFCLLVLAYLTFISIASLLGKTSLIFPGYILDEGLGIHADRARGPFLQAVANGVTLNLLGLLALDYWRRGRLRGPLALLLAAVPLAILATMTRAVWLSFSTSIIAVLLLTHSTRVRRACAGLIMAAGIATVLVLSMAGCRIALEDRLQERSPVEFRVSIYQVGWEMALEKPWFGWGQNQMPEEIAKRMSDYRPDTYCAHNTYLEVLVEHGLIGLALYAWMIVGLLRLGLQPNNQELTSTDLDSRRLWIVLLGVYLLNASFVVINYQFVNALFFTTAGILACQRSQMSHTRDFIPS